jgi:CheY-like chemotaxis protein
MAERILLIDDDKEQCEILEAALRGLGHDVTFTVSPRPSMPSSSAGALPARSSTIACKGR